MALIQKIREKSALVLVLMILAIVAFIGMLITQDSNRSWSELGNTTTVAKVAGKSMEIRDLDTKAQIMYGNNGNDLGVRNSLFNAFVEDALVSKEAEKAGLGVSKDELIDLEFGQNVSPAILQNQALANPQTGQVDFAQLQQIKSAIQANTMPMEGKMYWAEIEKQVVKDRLQTKLTNLMTKGIYTPTWVVEEGYKELTEPATFEYVRVGFEQVPDAEAVISDSDIEKYISENKVRYMNEEETRTIEYVAFDVTATLEDSIKLREKIAGLKEAFRTTDKDSSFAITNNGSAPSQYQTKEQLSVVVKDSLFGAAVGSVLGPYVDAKAYFLAKVVDRKSAPDSVKARHILLKGAGMKKTADSLRDLLTANAAMWDSLNTKFSTDEVSKVKGGDLGYAAQGMYVPEFNDLLFYKAAQGPFYTVESQFGTHIVQVTGIKAGKNESRVKVAYVREPIVPSSKTDRAASAAADELLLSSKNGVQLKENATKKNVALLPAPPVKANDLSLGTFGQANGVRQLIRWAYEAKVGDRANQTFAIQQPGDPYVSQYVVAAVKTVAPKGIGTVAALKEQLTPAVRNKKKVEILKTKIGNPSDLNAVASQFNSKVDTAQGVTFNATFLPNIGTEPRVLAAAFTNEIGKVAAPIGGESGTFVIKVTQRMPLTSTPVDKTVLRQQMSGNIKGMIRNSLVRGLRKNASITDNRSKFF